MCVRVLLCLDLEAWLKIWERVFNRLRFRGLDLEGQIKIWVRILLGLDLYIEAKIG